MIHKMKISNTPLCRICNLENETLFHLLCKCHAVTNLWQDLKVWIKNKINQNIDFDSKTIILGYLNTDNKSVPLNTIIMSTKYYIFSCAHTQTRININDAIHRSKEHYLEQSHIASKVFKTDEFKKIWASWKFKLIYYIMNIMLEDQSYSIQCRILQTLSLFTLFFILFFILIYFYFWL